jgi:murein DD-endopeptidase MepM/ murein hydrolase activator NlpD
MTAIDWPLDSNRIRRGMVNHTFGTVRRNPDGSGRPHQGWDFEAPEGTPCYAVANGTVVAVRNGGAYGRQVIIEFRHDRDGDGRLDLLFAHYAHLSRIDVTAGQAVTIGQQIGLTGNTGNAGSMRGPDQHLHFELRAMVAPGTGLNGRYSPIEIFRVCPLGNPVPRRGITSGRQVP